MKLIEASGGSDGPVYSSLRIIGRKWVAAIVRDMYLGKTHFSEFKQYKPGLTNTVLSDTLRFMEEEGLVDKVIHDRNNTEYLMTEKARKLNVIIYDLIEYGVDVLDCDNKNWDNFPEKIKKHYKKLLIEDDR